MFIQFTASASIIVEFPVTAWYGVIAVFSAKMHCVRAGLVTAAIGVGGAFWYCAISFVAFIVKEVTYLSCWTVGIDTTPILRAEMICAYRTAFTALIIVIALPWLAHTNQTVIMIAAEFSRFTVSIATTGGI